jgi:type III pantothenate kinase
MILVFDVGNTETVIGLFERATLLDHWRVSTTTERTVDEWGLLIRALVRESGFDLDPVTAVAIGSVVPPVNPLLTEMCERHLGARVLMVDARTPLPIRIAIEEPLTVGADRIANTLAAASLFRRDTIAVDFGTATTFDCIGGDGTFVGGVIAPGVTTGAETLVRRTAKLPRIELRPPATVIGKRTEASLRSGIFHAAVDSIDGIVRRIREEWERPNALVVATGGLAPLIGPHCRTVDRIEPYLTLQGLEIAYRYVEERATSRTRARRG